MPEQLNIALDCHAIDIPLFLTVQLLESSIHLQNEHNVCWSSKRNAGDFIFPRKNEKDCSWLAVKLGVQKKCLFYFFLMRMVCVGLSSSYVFMCPTVWRLIMVLLV